MWKRLGVPFGANPFFMVGAKAMRRKFRIRARREPSEGRAGSARIFSGRFFSRFGQTLLALGLTALLTFSAHSQDERSTRAPDVGRVGGTSRLAFSGVVTTVDLDKKLLHVDTVEGTFTEIFPLKKGFEISSARGGRMKVEELKPGMNVIVYYRQKGGRRNVTEIMVIGTASSESDKKDKDKEGQRRKEVGHLIGP